MDASIKSANGDPLYMVSVARGMQVLEYIANSKTGISLRELTEATDLPHASIWRAVATLKQLRLVERKGRNLVLAPRVLSIAWPGVYW